jgi:hypothetical protein
MLFLIFRETSTSPGEAFVKPAAIEEVVEEPWIVVAQPFEAPGWSSDRVLRLS